MSSQTLQEWRKVHVRNALTSAQVTQQQINPQCNFRVKFRVVEWLTRTKKLKEGLSC